MAESTTFDPRKLLSSDLADCAQEQILELVRKLCKIAAEECGENGYRGGFRPGNIYATEDGRVAVGKPSGDGDDGWTKIELEYMSPEQFWNGEKNAAGDVYSIALIMYAGLNGGKLPFLESSDATGELRAAALRKRMSGDTLAVPDGVDVELARILMRALEFDPAKRYENAAELLAALEEYCGVPQDEEKEANVQFKLEETPHGQPALEEIPSEQPAQTESAPADEPKPELKPEPEPEKPAEPPKAAAKKVPEAKSAPKKDVPQKPAEEKPMPEKSEPSRKASEKRSINRHQRQSYIRSALTLGVIALLLVGVGFARNIDLPSVGSEPDVKQTEAPVVSQPSAEPSAEPTAEPSAQPEQKPAEVQYMLYSADLSWQEAEEKCVSIGGHLATIKTEDDFARICSLLDGSDAQYVWVGAVRGDDGAIKWTDGASYDYYVWAPGEPSLSDSYDGATENYIMLVKQSDGTWAYNDSRADPMESYSRYYSGKMAYICQIG